MLRKLTLLRGGLANITEANNGTGTNDGIIRRGGKVKFLGALFIMGIYGVQRPMKQSVTTMGLLFVDSAHRDVDATFNFPNLTCLTLTHTHFTDSMAA